MSRETNSLLLRYGFNSFWSSSLVSSRLCYAKLQYNSFFFLLLRNYFLQPLKIQYFTFYINVYVFYFKEDRDSFLFKFLKLKKVIQEVLILRKNYGFFFKKDLIKKKNNISFFNLNLFSFLNKKFFSYTLLAFLKKQTIIAFLYVKQSHIFVKKKKTFFFLKWKLKYLNKLLQLKWLGLLSSTLLFHYTQRGVKIIFKSVLEKSTNFIRFPFFFKYLKINALKEKFYLICLSFIFFKANILNNYLNLLIKKTKNKKHIKNLVYFFDELKILFNKHYIPLSGLKFKISGRLNGKLRKSKFGFKLGFIQLMSIKTVIDFSCDFIYTQYGSFSLKLWLCDKTSRELL